MSLQSSTPPPPPRPRGKERWNLLRDVHLGATAARSVTTLKEPIELGNCATAAKTLPPASLAPQLEKQQIVPTTSCSQQSVCSPLLSEPAPEPGLEGEAGEEPEADAGSQGGEGEDSSDWSSEVSNEKLILDDIPTIKVHDTKLVEHLSHNRQSESGANNKREFQIPLHLLQSGSSARMRLSQRKQSTRRAEEGGTRGATSTDLMASMVNGFTSLTNFKFSGEKAESEDEVHNAWGDEDTADDFGNRVHDLQEARGITLGPAPSAARARRAQRKQKQKPEEVCARQSSLVANDHSNSNIAGPDRQTFFAASGVVTSLLSNLSMSMSISGTAENVKDNAKYPEAEQQSGMAMPMLTSHSLGRERYARRKGKLDSTALPQGTLSPFVSAGVESASSSASVALSDASSLVRLGRRRANPPGFAEAADSFVVYGTNHGSSFLAAATLSLVAFQRLFQTEDEETYSIWGPDDTPEQYQQRLTALERARGEPNASMLHHRLMRRRKKRQQVSHGTQDAEEDPFLLR